MSSDMDCYRQALDAFCVAAKNEAATLTGASLYVRLHLNGTWEITDLPTCNLRAAFYESGKLVPHGICLPLVLPLSKEALVSCLEEKCPLVEAKEREEEVYRERESWHEDS